MSFGLHPIHTTAQDALDLALAFFTRRATAGAPRKDRRRLALCTFALALAVISLAGAPLYTQAAVDAPLTPLYAIQGSGEASPLQGTRVTARGLVSGVTVDGFFIQDPAGDGDPITSDALFVYTWARPEVTPGQCVQVVDGLVTEFYAKTELTRAAAILPATGCGGALTPVELPAARLGVSPTLALEPWEGMLVRLPRLAGAVHGPTRHYAEGERELALLPAAWERVLRPGHLWHDQPEAAALLTYVNNRLGADLPEASFGQVVTGPPGLLAVVDYAFGKVQVLPLPGQPLTVTGQVAPPLPVAPAAADEYTLCSYNLNGLGRGQAQLPDAAAYAAALAQRGQTLAQMLQGCTIIALQETGTPGDAAALAAHLADVHGLDYAATALWGPASADSDFPLTNSLLTRRGRVQVAAATLAQGCSAQDYGVQDPGVCAAGLYPLFARPPLVAQLQVSGDWPGGTAALWVIGNHWKSKAGDEAVNAVRRLAQAKHVAGLVQTLAQADPTAQVVVAGDLNDYFDSPPVRALMQSVKPPLLHALAYLPALDRYTYIYNGAAQVLDHLLLSANLGPQVAAVQVLHLNADFATGRGPVRGSDHDPILLRIRPGGAASAGGNLGFAQIAVEAISAGGVRVAESVSDAAGEYRLWGLPVDTLTLRFHAPPGVQVTPATLTWQAAPGYQPAPSPQVYHRTARAAAALALVTPNLAVQSLAPAQPAQP